MAGFFGDSWDESRQGRYMRFVEKIPGIDCWIWSGSSSLDGYGRFRSRVGKVENATKIMLRDICNIDVPDGMIVMHKCDTPSCVRPEHLVVGTHKQNAQDRGKKGRHAVAEKSGKAKLSPDDVLEIKASKERHCDLARKFGVDPSTIHNIRTRKHYKSVEPT